MNSYYKKKKIEQKPYVNNNVSIYQQRKDYYQKTDVKNQIKNLLGVKNLDETEVQLKMLPGYMPLRNEFDDEYLNWAEYYF